MRLNPPVTWLLSVKNGMPYLPLTLESIANQTYTNHKVLAWDDCSTDESIEELRRWIPSRIPGRIFEGKSLRLGPCLAFLVEQADTELCARIDADDIAQPYRLERQVAYMAEHPELGVLGSDAQLIDANGKELNLWHFPPNDADTRWLMRFNTRVLHPSLMFRRSAVLEAGNYPDFKYEDCVLWTRMSVGKWEIQNIPEPLIKYRRTSTSGTGLIEDWVPVNRQVAQFCASIIFPGIPDGAQAMALWEATRLDKGKIQTKLRHLNALDKAAVAHARHVGKPDDYFLNCDGYKEQRYHVRRRILESFGLGILIRLRGRLARSGVRPLG
jgi:cellulose synthase/poly-beta-1,6-N-acetylglucosamine synthase-like glycosyltransferase